MADELAPADAVGTTHLTDGFTGRTISAFERELYFLIAKYLTAGPCRNTARVLREELEREHVVPRRIDWLGGSHPQSFEEWEQTLGREVRPDHLRRLLDQLNPLLREQQSIPGPRVHTLIGSGRHTLLRSQSSKVLSAISSSLEVYHGSNSTDDALSSERLAVRLRGCPLRFHPDHPASSKAKIVDILRSREVSGGWPFANGSGCVPNHLVSGITFLRRTIGHLSAVYCSTFDRTGRFLVTGADDSLVKIWKVFDGRLVATLRGCAAEVTDITINEENTLVAIGSNDKLVRVWCLATATPVAILTGNAVVTSLAFCPAVGEPGNAERYLIHTSADGAGTVYFWSYTCDADGRNAKFNLQPETFLERMRPGQAKIICGAFSMGGHFYATGSADHNVRVYQLYGKFPDGTLCGPKRILEQEQHTDDVNSIQWAQRSVRFISGSNDGTAIIWTYSKRQWKTLKLEMATDVDDSNNSGTRDLNSRATSTFSSSSARAGRSNNLNSNQREGAAVPRSQMQNKHRVTMVAWMNDDRLVVTAVATYLIKIWDSRTGDLTCVLSGHNDEVFCLETHPFDNRLLLSAGHDGNIKIWDVTSAVGARRGKRMPSPLWEFTNTFHAVDEADLDAGVERRTVLTTGGVFDARWSPDGSLIACTDSHGHIILYGHGVNVQRYQRVPGELFFHTDYRPLMRDANNYVLDEQTQVAPHLMPPPILVDMAGNPHPDEFQYLVPGRDTGMRRISERVSEGDEEEQAMQQPVRRTQGDHSVLDLMIERLAREQGKALLSVFCLHGNQNQMSDPRRRRTTTSSSHASIDGESQEGNEAEEEPESDVANLPVSPPLSRRAQAHALRSERVANRVNRVHSSERSSRDNDSVSHASDTNREGESEAEEAQEIRPLEACCPIFVPKLSSVEFRRMTRHRERLKAEEMDQFNRESTAISTPSSTANAGGISSRATANVSDDSDSGDGRRRIRRPTVDRRRRNDGERGEGEEEATATPTSSSSEEEEDGSDWENREAARSAARTRRRALRSQQPSRASSSRRSRSQRARRRRRQELYSAAASGGRSSSSRRNSRAAARNARNRLAEAETSGGERRKSSRASRRVPQRDQSDEATESEESVRGRDEIPEPFLPEHTPWLSGDQPVKTPSGPNSVPKVVAKVSGVTFDLKPPRLVSVKLNMIDNDGEGRVRDDAFSVKYHDVPGVVDFIVLKQHFDDAMRRQWREGDRFCVDFDGDRSFGVIVGQDPYEPEVPSSPFCGFCVRWDHGEMDRLSAWDMEPCPPESESRRYSSRRTAVTPRTSTPYYVPATGDWPHGNVDSEKTRIGFILKQVMKLPLAKPFTKPVNLDEFPDYAMRIEYPIDLSLIRRRLESGFYRRAAAVLFDVSYIGKNAAKFNVEGSLIVYHAHFISELCKRLIITPSETVQSVYDSLVEHYATENVDLGLEHLEPVSSTEDGEEDDEEDEEGEDAAEDEPEEDEEAEDEEDGCPRGVTRSSRRRAEPSSRTASNRTNNTNTRRTDWREACLAAMRQLMRHEDAGPFLQPVDLSIYEDYLDCVEDPIDFSTIEERLSGPRPVYRTFADFREEVERVFTNSRLYNTNHRSRVHFFK
ncbi:unnamed protein product [Notodromas monacha]|uniref:Bromo domain-containing protein n=1 Tax=Notodromas monacha TaxID=399045 RepID=A0A7R9GCY4_9CRUS|nr:unnamed protein product [Notodromas monacha]CAG0918143.1 unnamed protein product [Notodromas monacha]